ncbi:DUF4309 domain-containing protein [Pseudobutyrivibrio ruminis]|uniref:Lipoprotein n=1 Tax=Pseudobutyrivibrio ruminis TaxID=46206 RepID=A0A2G3DRM7_9FIRM|nr:DUF4309 domain-containing protein [Pseudobutyrivibrio ruminis]PHU33533.1 hypothetical protein CSX01_13430 [Pseudobutyrivibrio ruminis]
MNKKFLVLLMTIGLSIVACGKNDDFYNEDNGCGVSLEECPSECDIAEESLLTAEDDKLEVTVENEKENISFSILDDGKTVLEKLGEPASTTDDGDYHTCKYYNAGELTYSTEGDTTEIVEFKSFSDDWKTSKGITVGSTIDEILKAYGESACEYESEDGDHMISYTYTNGYSIYFTINDNNEVAFFQMCIGRG